MKMADIWIPKKVPLFQSKELHGRVRIDLHNVRSGSNERIEAHNVVTDAVDEFMLLNYFAFMRNNSGARYGSVYAGLFGGCCLFEEEINGGNMLPFGANKLVGYAGDSATISGNRGYYNGAESSFNGISGVARTVWDWGTSQANGTIKAVARTSSSTGNGSFGNKDASNESGRAIPQDMADNNTNYFGLVGTDKADGKMFLYRSSDSSYYVMNFTPTFKINDGSITWVRFPRAFSDLTRICGSAAGSNGNVHWYDPTTKKLHWIGIVTAGTVNDGVIRLYEVDTTALVPSETYTDITLVGAKIVNSWSGVILSGGYIYLYGYNPNDTSQLGIYRTSLADPTDIQFYNLTTRIAATGWTFVQLYNNRIRPWGVAGMEGLVRVQNAGNNYYSEFTMDKDGNFMFGGLTEPGLSWSTSEYNYYDRWEPLAAGEGVDNWMLKYGNYLYNYSHVADTRKYIIRNDFNYMATICNLGTAVTKTSSETMKLTYTLSDT